MTDYPSIELSDSLNEQVYQAVRDAIISGRLQLGERVVERKLAADLKVSPTPVREALLRLEQEGLIERRKPRNLYVARISSKALSELIYIEALLRGAAARMAAPLITPQLLDRLSGLLETSKTAIERGDAETTVACSEEFHRTINETCGNPILISFLRTIVAFDVSHRVLVLQDEMEKRTPHLMESYREHLAIIEALARHDAGAAETATVQHTLRASQRYME